ncbi:MAG TPA: fluoride efflux transporter CrcB [Beijerinckiaceae bacterium]|nr:fluoride efflux transporter CrcB [Beijerinckiaceae bacterium]
MKGLALVFLGAGLGGALRHAVNVGAARAFGAAFPWHTVAVNVVGSVAMGLLAGWLAVKAGKGWTEPVRLFVATGLLGGFTTFSAFSLDAVVLWQRGEAGAAAAYGLASVALSIGGLLAGLFIVRVLTS